MNKFFKILFIAFICVITQVNAQTATPKDAPLVKEKKVRKSRAAVKADAAASASGSYSSTAAASAPAAPVSTSGTLSNGVKLKKDGSVDKRFKAKQAAVTGAMTTPVASGAMKAPEPVKSAKSALQNAAPAAKAVSSGSVKAQAAMKSPASVTNTPEAMKAQATAAGVNAKGAAVKSTVAKTADAIDASLHGPHNEAVMTGTRGGKYYINKNGHRTYLKADKK